jgi:hypothetical protein
VENNVAWDLIHARFKVSETFPERLYTFILNLVEIIKMA